MLGSINNWNRDTEEQEQKEACGRDGTRSRDTEVQCPEGGGKDGRIRKEIDRFCGESVGNSLYKYMYILLCLYLDKGEVGDP